MRLVVDTNVFISAIIFKGEANKLVDFWQQKKLNFLLSRPILLEYIRVLGYPKFRLNNHEIKSIIEEELLPYTETVKIKNAVSVIKSDPTDNIFLSTALDGDANYILSGDKHLLELKTYESIGIINIREFFRLDSMQRRV